MSVISKIKLPNNQTYELKDNGALQLTGGSVTGETTFGDSAEMDEVTISSLIVTGSASFTSGLNASQITSGTLSVARLATSGASAGSYGPSANATLSTGSTFSIPYVTVDVYGRVTSIASKTMTVSNMTDTTKLPLTGGTVTGATEFTNSVDIDEAAIGALIVSGSASFTNGLSGALTGSVNGYTVAEAGAKSIVTDISNNLLSTNLPTSAAVANFVASYVGSTHKETTLTESTTSTDAPTAAAVVAFVKQYVDDHCITFT
jgi:hypothetical protein